MFDPVGTSKKWSKTGVIHAIMLSNLFLWNHSLRTQINLHHCSPEETVRGERAKSVVKTSFVTTKPAENAQSLVHASCMQTFFAQLSVTVLE